MAGVTPAIVMARANVTLGTGQSVRLAVSGPVGPQLPALLGLELLGAQVTPVFGLIEQDATRAAFVDGKVDVVLAWGQGVPAQVDALCEAGAKPLFGLGALDANGLVGRDPAVPRCANVVGAIRGVASAQRRPARASMPGGPRASATRLEFGLVLPRLTSAAMVALWRRAASQATGAASRPGPCQNGRGTPRWRGSLRLPR